MMQQLGIIVSSESTHSGLGDYRHFHPGCPLCIVEVCVLLSVWSDSQFAIIVSVANEPLVCLEKHCLGLMLFTSGGGQTVPCKVVTCVKLESTVQSHWVLAAGVN